MAAMKNGYGYVYDWNVSPPSTKDWFLSPRSYNDVKFLLVTDQNFRSDHPNHEADAYSLTLSAAEPWFKEEHGILLVKYVYKGNYTRTSTDCATIANEVKTIYGQPSGTEAILIVVGRNVDLKLNNESVLGCAIIPNVGGTYPWAIVKEVSNDPGRLSMHEISHLYGLQHVRDGLGNPLQDFKTVMHKYFDDPMSIKNWSPTEDNNLESRRGWY
ncbi:MAG: hypothetical protein QXY14_03325 [Candidatus Nitrosocaldus sp.]